MEHNIFFRPISVWWNILLLNTLRKKYPYSELFWSAFFPHFPTFELNTERYSVRMRENAGKMRTRITPNFRFSYAGTWELVNLFVRTKSFSYHICYENIERKHNKILWSQETDSPWTDRTGQYASKEECIKWNK